MRYVLSILVLFFSISLMTTSCGGDDTDDNNNSTTTCSPSNPTGTCDDGKTCDNGICKDNGTCTPKTCTELSRTCGSVDDGCGTALACGSCNAGETCNTAGTCETGTCTPKTCTDLSRECGSANDGCGDTLECGTCATGTCNASGVCEAPAVDGELGGLCGGDTQVTCADTTNECLTVPGDASGICYQSCNGENDTSCTQNNYTCQALQSGEFFCFPNPNGNTPIGGDCANEACVVGAQCLSTGAGTPQICYENCTAATDTCATGGYTCQDTGVAGIDWICMEGAAGPGNTPIGGDCANEACVVGAQCLNTGAGTPQICYENCTAATDTCATGGYTCQDTGVAGIDWICMVNPVGTTVIGGDCSTEACVAEATCGTTSAGSICYEDCASATDTCSTGTYECQETPIGWLCAEVIQPGTTAIGGDCSTENCVAGASCLGDGTTSICYEDCSNNTGGICTTSGYTCQAIDGGAEFCFEAPTGK